MSRICNLDSREKGTDLFFKNPDWAISSLLFHFLNIIAYVQHNKNVKIFFLCYVKSVKDGVQKQRCSMCINLFVGCTKQCIEAVQIHPGGRSLNSEAVNKQKTDGNMTAKTLYHKAYFFLRKIIMHLFLLVYSAFLEIQRLLTCSAEAETCLPFFFSANRFPALLSSNVTVLSVSISV